VLPPMCRGRTAAAARSTLGGDTTSWRNEGGAAIMDSRSSHAKALPCRRGGGRHEGRGGGSRRCHHAMEEVVEAPSRSSWWWKPMLSPHHGGG
jgi:hypothetical protein